MKIETGIDEVVCIGVTIESIGVNPIVSVKYGYLADGVKCGEVSYRPQHSNHMSDDIDDKVRELLLALENDFVKKFGNENVDEPREIEGLVKEF